MKMITCIVEGKIARNTTTVMSLSMITAEETVLNSLTINMK